MYYQLQKINESQSPNPIHKEVSQQKSKKQKEFEREELENITIEGKRPIKRSIRLKDYI